jgi:hypothetical protein
MASFKATTNRALLDVFLLISLSFVALFVLAVMLMNPVMKARDVEKKAQYMIVLDWQNESADDVDMWIRVPGKGKPISFKDKSNGALFIDRDDRGKKNDKAVGEHGEEIQTLLNREVVSIRGIITGEYAVNIHMYLKRDVEPAVGTVQMIQINPYKILYNGNFTLSVVGEEQHMFRFRLKANGKMTDVETRSIFFIKEYLGPVIHGHPDVGSRRGL